MNNEPRSAGGELKPGVALGLRPGSLSAEVNPPCNHSRSTCKSFQSQTKLPIQTCLVQDGALENFQIGKCSKIQNGALENFQIGKMQNGVLANFKIGKKWMSIRTSYNPRRTMRILNTIVCKKLSESPDPEESVLLKLWIC